MFLMTFHLLARLDASHCGGVNVSMHMVENIKKEMGSIETWRRRVVWRSRSDMRILSVRY